MSDKGWDKMESILISLFMAVGICSVILGICWMMYMTGVDTHEYEMGLIDSCAVEYRFENNIHWVSKEYCGNTVTERVQVVTVQNPATQQVVVNK